MMRFFFDYAAQGQAAYDYRGDDFRNPQDAIDFARAIADGLKHSPSEEWAGWCLEMRNRDGVKFVSLPLDPVVVQQPSVAIACWG